VRAGFAVTTIDAFADLDLHPAVRGLSVPRDFGTSFSPEAAARAASDLAVEAAVYGANFENHPEAVTALAAGRPLWGNPPAVLRRVRDPRQLADLFRRRGIPAPAVWMNAPNDTNGSNDPNDPNDRLDRFSIRCRAEALASADTRTLKRALYGETQTALVKPLSSGGGRGVRAWVGGDIPLGCYLQQRIEGVPGSLVFVAAGGRSVPLAISRQLVGDPAFGADGFMYCGNILAAVGDPQFRQDEALVGAASAIARAVAEEFELVGVNGVDFIAADGVPYPIEVNPRWCASMELVERAYGVSMFGLHAAACTAGTLPVFDLSRARSEGNTVGKAIIFARRDVTLGNTREWLEDATVRDVPHPGERIAEGHPICTVLAEGEGAAARYTAPVHRASRV